MNNLSSSSYRRQTVGFLKKPKLVTLSHESVHMKAFGLNFVVEYYYEYTHNPEESGYDDYQNYRVCAVVPKNGLSSRFAQAVKELGGQERKNAFVVQVKESSYEIHNLEQEVKACLKGISELAYSKKKSIRI